MKPRESALRLMRFEAREKARKVSDLESMIREFELMIDDLDRQIGSEEERTGVRDIKHFAYSTFAKAARQRRENLQTSVDDLKAKLALAVEERDIAVDNLDKIETPETREMTTQRTRRDGGERNPSALAS
ncbi:MAG: flagellar export protein FliJ [Hyphomicrobiaceae bacterium]